MPELHNIVDVWLRQGQPEPAPQALREHLQHCTRCKQALVEIEETRAWYPDPGECITEDAASAIRFQLQTAANIASQSRVAKPRSRFAFDRVQWAFAAVLLLTAVGAGFYASEWWSKTNHTSVPALAVLEPKAGARVHRISELERDEAYRLDTGVVRFSVPRLRGGRRVLVLVGEEMVSVRGTRFEVHAIRKRLQAVMVDEGSVGIHLQNGRELVVVAGQAWHRGGGVARHPQPARAKVQPAIPRRKGVRTPTGATAQLQSESDRDTAFSKAWQMYQAGRYSEAAAAFDLLLGYELANRRSDVLYWAGMAHEAAGRPKRALSLLQELLRDYPDSWQATKAREKVNQLTRELGESGIRVDGQ